MGPEDRHNEKDRRARLERLLAEADVRDETLACRIMELFDEPPARSSEKGMAERFPELFDIAGDSIFVHDLQGHILAVNPVACRRLGYTREELVGRHVDDLSDNPSRERYQRLLERVRDRGTYAFEIVQQHRDGRLLTGEVNARIAEWRGSPVVVSIVRDLTARKVAESIMLEQKQFLSAVLENLPVGLLVKRASEDFTFLAWNAKMEQLTGRKRKDVLGRTDYDIFPEEQADYFRAMDRKTMEAGVVVDIPVEEVANGNGGFKAHTIKVPLYDAEGKPEALLGIIEDISERVNAEESVRRTQAELERRVEERTRELEEANHRLRAAEEHYRTLYEQAGEAIMVVADDGSVLETNPAAAKALGYDEQELRSLNARDLVHADEAAGVYESFRSLETGGRVNVELQVRRKDGGFAEMEMSATRMTGNRVLATMWDISERKQLEREMVRAKEAAEAASAAKSEFLANMSHEVRTPMGGIIGMTDMVLSSATDERQREYLKSIKTASLSLLDIINDILDFSKIEAKKLELKPERFNLPSRLEMLRETFSVDAANKGLDLELELDPNLPTDFYADAGRLGQVLANLLSNAIKFTDTGVVRLTAASRGERGGDHMVEFVVQDTGIGIPESGQDKLFDVFSQLDPALTKRQPGTGLGLAISQRLVQAMQGSGIELLSEPGSGSRFSFMVPLERREPARQSGGLSGSLVRRTDSPARLLLAEDNLLNQEFLTHFLAESGYVVDVAENGRMALQMLERRPYDLVLMDIQMPELDGLATTRIIREHDGSGYDPQVPVVALTAYAMKGDRERMLKAGMNGYLSKPVDMEKLFELIRELLGADQDSADQDSRGP